MEPTHEPELTAPVDLCTPDGKRLNPAARGWSRFPLHRANLRGRWGRWGRTKRWDYWAVLAGDLAIGLVYADVDYLGLASVWWGELSSGRTGGIDRGVPLARGFELPDHPGSRPLRYRDRRLSLEISNDPPLTRIRAAWTEKGGEQAELEVDIRHEPGHESLNVVIPWDERRFNFTTKAQALPATGRLQVGAEEFPIGGDDQLAWGVLDVGRGRWPYATNWNWGGGAGIATSGATVGIQFGAKWTEGTGFTENGILVDGRLHKIGRELTWEYSWERPMEPWRVTDPGGALDLTLSPRFDKHSKTDIGVLRTEVHQVFGTWSGTVVAEDGTAHTIEKAQGFAEESRSRW